jgi:anthranilate/para-aminobenzoate synthase component I
MTEAPEIHVKTVDDIGMDAITAFAKLRSYTPGRGTFLLEALAPDASAARYSVVGYRVNRSESMPPGVDAVAVQHDEMAAGSRPESLAEAIALGCMGYVNYGVATLRQGIRLCDDESTAGQFLVGATVMVFDHESGQVTVAGKKKGNLVERCIWEAKNGPAIEELEDVDEGAQAQDVSTVIRDEKFAAKAIRAKAFLGDELPRLILAQTYYAPVGESDPFDVYRAWRKLASSTSTGTGSFGYYIDMGETPMSPPLHVMGLSDELLFSRRRDHDDHGDPASVLADALPHRKTTGDPPDVAAKLIRRVEDSSRHLWGGAVGYFCPGGESQLVLADRVITAQSGNYWHTTGAELTEEGDAMEAPNLARQAANQGLEAIAIAQAQPTKKS